MLAMVVNDNAGGLTPSGVLDSIASMLAPTGRQGEMGGIRQTGPGICRAVRYAAGPTPYTCLNCRLR
jgi:hypothetical protein